MLAAPILAKRTQGVEKLGSPSLQPCWWRERSPGEPASQSVGVGALTLPRPMEVNAVRISKPVRGVQRPQPTAVRGSSCRHVFCGPGRAVQPRCAARCPPRLPTPTDATLDGQPGCLQRAHTHPLVTNTAHHGMHLMAMAGLPPIEAAWAASTIAI